jgi:hypothetical protein
MIGVLGAVFYPVILSLVPHGLNSLSWMLHKQIYSVPFNPPPGVRQYVLLTAPNLRIDRSENNLWSQAEIVLGARSLSAFQLHLFPSLPPGNLEVRGEYNKGKRTEYELQEY